MSDVDILHPIQCLTKSCEYNFCTSCVEHFIASSQCGYEEASDGSQQVKIHLICPQVSQ